MKIPVRELQAYFSKQQDRYSQHSVNHIDEGFVVIVDGEMATTMWIMDTGVVLFFGSDTRRVIVTANYDGEVEASIYHDVTKRGYALTTTVVEHMT